MFTGYENLTVTYKTKAFDALATGLQQAIKSSILCQLAYLYVNRGDANITSEATSILSSYKVINVF